MGCCPAVLVVLCILLFTLIIAFVFAIDIPSSQIYTIQLLTTISISCLHGENAKSLNRIPEHIMYVPALATWLASPSPHVASWALTYLF